MKIKRVNFEGKEGRRKRRGAKQGERGTVVEKASRGRVIWLTSL